MAETVLQEAPQEPSDHLFEPSPEYYAIKKAYLSQQRLSMLPSQRIFLATSIGTIAGGLSGLFQGANMAGLRFRAENAHRLPSTQAGWYLYHKSKNYHIMLGGIKKGFKESFRIGSMVCFFVLSEEAVDRLRAWYTRGPMKRKDVCSTVIAALGTSAAFSLWNRFPLPTAARTAKLGLAFGLIYGLGQDALGYAAGRVPGYIEVLRRLRGKSNASPNQRLSSNT